jgi:hypothetical protein
MRYSRMAVNSQKFSAGYEIVHNATVRRWDEDLAVMDSELYRDLANEFQSPVVGYIDGVHYQFTPSNQVLSHECAIPGENIETDDPALLIWR